jgi:hypothetical protein
MMLILLQFAQDLDMNVEKTDHRFMMHVHSFLLNDAEFGTRENATFWRNILSHL